MQIHRIVQVQIKGVEQRNAMHLHLPTVSLLHMHLLFCTALLLTVCWWYVVRSKQPLLRCISHAMHLHRRGPEVYVQEDAMG